MYKTRLRDEARFFERYLCVMLVRYTRAVCLCVMQGITHMSGYERRTQSI